jgi:ubiquinone/menaquinone biosynthesis C-methylase UbiE
MKHQVETLTRSAAPTSSSSGLAVRLLRRVGDMNLKRTEEAELLDGLDWSPAELAQNFRDIERVNRLLGGIHLTVGALARQAEPIDGSQDLSVLDVGTGSADIPVGIVQWARRSRRRVSITAVDSREEILDLARDRVAPYPQIRLVKATAPGLPFPDSSFDVATCSLVAHHLGPDSLLQLMREMSRVARHAIIVNDLVRNRAGYEVARILGFLTTRNRLTRNDGPLSIRKSYTVDELCAISEDAGIRVASIEQFALYRVALTCIKESA